MIKKSKDKQQLALVVEENENYKEQARALQQLLRDNADELEKYKAIAEAAGTQSGSVADGGATDAAEAQCALKDASWWCRACYHWDPVVGCGVALHCLLLLDFLLLLV